MLREEHKDLQSLEEKQQQIAEVARQHAAPRLTAPQKRKQRAALEAKVQLRQADAAAIEAELGPLLVGNRLPHRVIHAKQGRHEALAKDEGKIQAMQQSIAVLEAGKAQIEKQLADLRAKLVDNVMTCLLPQRIRAIRDPAQTAPDADLSLQRAEFESAFAEQTRQLSTVAEFVCCASSPADGQQGEKRLSDTKTKHKEAQKELMAQQVAVAALASNAAVCSWRLFAMQLMRGRRASRGGSTSSRAASATHPRSSPLPVAPDE